MFTDNFLDEVHNPFFSANTRRSDRTYTTRIVFGTIGNGTVAKIDRKKRWIFFPQDFDAVPGREYECSVRVTVTGVYKYNGDSFRVCRAYLRSEGLAHVEPCVSQPKLETESPFVTALKDFQAPKYVEKHILKARKDSKSGKIGFPPIYKDEDSDFGDIPTMYFLNTTTKLVEGKEYKIRLEEKSSTNQRNRRGALMVRVKVAIE